MDCPQRGPLAGRRVVVTRAAEQAPALVARLKALGADVVTLPVVEIVDPADGGAALRSAAAMVHSYDWLIFTSANAVDRFLPLVEAPLAAAVAAIGPGTAAALAAGGVPVDLVPERSVAESLLDAMPSDPGRVLLPQAAPARPVLADGLRAKGWDVDVVEAYRTVPATPPPEALAAVRSADAITFASSSAVAAFLAAAAPCDLPPVVACIGPVTAATARDAGIDVDVVAQVHTLDGLVAALAVAWGDPQVEGR